MRKLLQDPVCTISIINRAYENWSNYKKQHNIYTNFLKKTKTDYFNNIDIKKLNVTDNKTFWTVVKRFFKDKFKTCNNLILNEGDKTINDVMEITDKFNKYFANVIKKLNMEEDTGISFESQESCRMIKRNFEKKISLLKSSLKTRLQTQLKIHPQARQVFQMIFQFLF